MDKNQFQILVQKYLNGTATTDELMLLHKWYDSFDDEQVQYLEDNEDDLKKRLWNRLDPSQTGTAPGPAVAPVVRSWMNSIWYAAAAVLLLSIGAGLFFSRNQPSPANQELSKARNFRPRGNNAILTLANGKTVVLGGKSAAEVRNEDNRLIAFNDREGLKYQPGNAGQEESANETNILTTPRGTQYHLVLPDGTKVWLNAASSITFPVAFTGDERKVQITGEVYFEVAKDASRPFRVLSNHQVVEVLGTHFNINAYSDEPFTSTTLLEGKVKVSSGTDQLLLNPGQQSIHDGAGLKLNPKIDAEETIAWKSGNFTFDHERIESVMRKIARWYDLDVSYEGAVSKDWFGGSVSRNESAADILGKLQLTGQIHFKIEGRRVIVLQ